MYYFSPDSEYINLKRIVRVTTHGRTMRQWLASLLEVAVGAIILGLILFAVGLHPVGAILIPFTFGLLVWLGIELHRWEKKHGID